MESAEIFLCDTLLPENFWKKKMNYCSCHIMFLTQFQQCNVRTVFITKSTSDHHPNETVTYTNSIDGMSPPPCHLVWHVVNLEKVWVGEVLAV